MTETFPHAPRAARPGERRPEGGFGGPGAAELPPVDCTRDAPGAPHERSASGEFPAIRRLSYADLPQVIAIERRAFPTPWSLAMFVLELSKPSGIFLAATRGERLVGYMICSRYDRVWHLMNIAVDPRLRRRGVASALMRRLFEDSDSPTAQYTLEVRFSNRPAIAMYERFGFRPAGRRRGYYHDNREDALIMWRTVEEGGRLPAAT